MNDFTLSEFWPPPLGLTTLVLCLSIGLVLGVVLRSVGHRFGWPHLFWQSAGGVVFFVPLALFRTFEGSDAGDHILGTGILWLVFTAGMNLGNRVSRQ